LPDDLSKLVASSERRDALATREAAHRLYGMVGAVSSLASNLASEIENLADANQLEGAVALVPSLAGMIGEILASAPFSIERLQQLSDARRSR
jgi:hypothetical protein